MSPEQRKNIDIIRKLVRGPRTFEQEKNLAMIRGVICNLPPEQGSQPNLFKHQHLGRWGFYTILTICLTVVLTTAIVF